MPTYTYGPAPVLVETTGEFAIGATGVLRATTGGDAVAVTDLNGSPIPSVLVGPKGAHQAFKADIAFGILDFGSVQIPAVSLEAQAAALDAQQTADAAMDAASGAVTSASAAQAAAAASATSAAESAAIAAAAGTGGGGGGSSVGGPHYYVSVSGGTYTATPRSGSGLAAFTGTNFTTVLQGAITALTPSGARGSGGGHIHIASGIYFFGNEVTIIGWEGISGPGGVPESQLIITGDGSSTVLAQNTAGQNGLVVKNLASVVLRDFRMYSGASAKSCLLGDNNGALSEMSMWKSTIDNVMCVSNSTTSPAVYLKNFFALSIPSLIASNNANHGLVIENDSPTTNYGNSHFGMIACTGSTSTPYAGLVFRTTNDAHFMNLVLVDHYSSNDSYYGLYASGLRFSTFSHVDLENNEKCVFLTGGTGLGESRHNMIVSGYLQPRDVATGTAITNTLYTGGNHVAANLAIGSTAVPIVDQRQFRPRNRYDVALGDQTQVDRITVTDAAHTEITAALTNGDVVRLDNTTN